MIKIIANYIRCKNLLLIAVSGVGISACAPIPIPQFPVQLPQSYPIQAPRQQPAQVIPRAGDLPVNKPAPAVVQSYPAVQQRPRQAVAAKQPSQPKQQRQQSTRVHVPPTLRPTQQRSVPAVQPSNANRYGYRPSASVARKPAVEYKEKAPIWTSLSKTPSASVQSRQDPAVNSRKSGISGSLTPGARMPTVRPAPRPSASVKPEMPSPSTSARPAAKMEAQKREVLDLSNASQKPTAAAVQTEKKPEAPVRNYSSSPAVSILIKQANNDLTAGKTDRAAATLERALRISPGNPMLWLRLAEVNAQQGNKTQAASMAKKAIGLAPDDANLRNRGQRLIN